MSVVVGGDHASLAVGDDIEASVVGDAVFIEVPKTFLQYLNHENRLFSILGKPLVISL